MAKNHLLIIDVPALVFRGFYALPSLTTPDGEPAGALYGFVSLLMKAIETVKPTHIVAALDLPEPTFRHRAYKEYKATRPEMPEELSSQFGRIPTILKGFGILALSAPGFEADDVIATVVDKSQAKDKNLPVTVLTSDLDALQLVSDKVVILAPHTGISKTVRYTKKAVAERFGIGPELIVAYKALRGDPSDNIPGVVGIGEKGASQILAAFGSVEAALEAACGSQLPADSEQAKIIKRYGQKLCASRKEIPGLLDLVTLRKNVPIQFTFDELTFLGVQTSAMQELFSRLGFKRFFEQASPTAKTSLRGQHPDIEAFIADQEKNVGEEIERLEASGALSKEIAVLEQNLIPVISDMERRGILVDRELFSFLAEEFRTRQEELSERIYVRTGMRFNLASPKQVSEVLFVKLGIASGTRTPKGAASSARGVLEDLAATHEVVADILQWREVEKLLTTYVVALPKLIDARDSRIHAQFWQLGTATGRIASSSPNLQQIPTRTHEGRRVREAFIAGEGKVLVSADYSQMELRIAAILADDHAMLTAFRAGYDIHRVTAAKIFSVQENKVTKDMRYRAKTLNFGILYGMGPRRLAKEAEMPFDEAQTFIDSYFAQFPGIARWIARTKEGARRNGFVETVFGRKRFLSDLGAQNERLRVQAERAAVNMPVQGTAADLVKKAMVQCANKVPEAKLLVQVHDELLFEVPHASRKEILEAVSGILQGVWTGAPIPLAVDFHCGQRWGKWDLELE